MNADRWLRRSTAARVRSSLHQCRNWSMPMMESYEINLSLSTSNDFWVPIRYFIRTSHNSVTYILLLSIQIMKVISHFLGAIWSLHWNIGGKLGHSIINGQKKCKFPINPCTSRHHPKLSPLPPALNKDSLTPYPWTRHQLAWPIYKYMPGTPLRKHAMPLQLQRIYSLAVIRFTASGFSQLLVVIKSVLWLLISVLVILKRMTCN